MTDLWMSIFIFLTTLFAYYCWNLRPPKYPPGPLILPVLGSVLSIDLFRIHLYLEEAKKKYGPIIGTKLAIMNFVFFCSPKHVFQVLKMDEFQGRPKQIAITSQTAVKGIILTDGPFWATQRRFTLRHLRDFGFGKTSAEGIMLQEIDDFFEQSLYEKNVIQTHNLFNTSAINVLWTLMAGKRYQHDDKSFKVLLDALHSTFREGGFNSRFEFLRKNSKAFFGFPDKIACEETLINFIKDSIKEHKENPSDEARDFIDVYLQEIEAGRNPDFTELSLISICIDLFTAGSESVGNTITFTLLYAVLYPELQEEVWQEVDSVLGGRMPLLSDRKSMPKLNAFLTEVYRINTIAPITVPKRATKDVEYEGYRIPKDTFIIISLWSVFRDKEHWGDPDAFRPWRFLDQEGQYINDNWMINFGIGKRQCPGESLTRSLLFLFLVRLFQEFKFSIPKGAHRPSTLAMAGFTTTSAPFEVEVMRRKL